MKLFGNGLMLITTQRGTDASQIPSSTTARRQHQYGTHNTHLTEKNTMRAITRKMRTDGTIELFRLMHRDMVKVVLLSYMSGMVSCLLLVEHGQFDEKLWKNTREKDSSFIPVLAHPPSCNTLMKCQVFRFKTFGQISHLLTLKLA